MDFVSVGDAVVVRSGGVGPGERLVGTAQAIAVAVDEHIQVAPRPLDDDDLGTAGIAGIVDEDVGDRSRVGDEDALAGEGARLLLRRGPVSGDER